MVVGVREINDSGPPVHLVGEHHAAVHPRLRHDHLAGQCRHLRRRSAVRRGGRAAHLHQRPIRRSPSRRSTSASTTPATWWPTPSNPRSTTSSAAAPTPRPTTRATAACKLSNLFDRLLFAIRFSDINLLISNQITDQSRIMFDRGVQARVNKAAPFLSLDADPYPGARQRPDRLGAGRLYHHLRLPLLPGRRHQRTDSGQWPQPDLQLRAELGQGPRSTRTPAK